MYSRHRLRAADHDIYPERYRQLYPQYRDKCRSFLAALCRSRYHDHGSQRALFEYRVQDRSLRRQHQDGRHRGRFLLRRAVQERPRASRPTSRSRSVTTSITTVRRWPRPCPRSTATASIWPTCALTTAITGQAEHYYYAVMQYETGFDDPAVVPDDMIMYALRSSGVADQPNKNFILDFNMDMIIFAIAEDAAGNFSPVYRHRIHLTKSGVSPIDDLISGAAPLGLCRNTFISDCTQDRSCPQTLADRSNEARAHRGRDDRARETPPRAGCRKRPELRRAEVSCASSNNPDTEAAMRPHGSFCIRAAE